MGTYIDRKNKPFLGVIGLRECMRLSDHIVTQIYFRCKDDETAPDDYGLGL